ncbi:hypothetical protein CPAR01_01043 [Colletotrichum paranaense]|uniref:Uncharacterized protein n=1 Tax=Colletotrichum paranaense TaxID=1914294 RepID=A0ABQ9T5Q0_9PEZI|nr:uncharacterized protein CPAR01_01043 [Colletotrichum paranaense]KAK1547076.1 hypothetical protein CPAR01_01043 [Colletotrichum paranaense]
MAAAFARCSVPFPLVPSQLRRSVSHRRTFELPWMVHDLFFCPLDALGLVVLPYQACKPATTLLTPYVTRTCGFACVSCPDESVPLPSTGKWEIHKVFLVRWVSAQMQQRSGRFQPSPSPPGPCRVIGYVAGSQSQNQASNAKQGFFPFCCRLLHSTYVLFAQLTTKFNFACWLRGASVIQLHCSPSTISSNCVTIQSNDRTDRPAARHAAVSTSAVPLSLEMFPNVSDGDHHTHPRSTTTTSPQAHNHASRLSYDTHPLPLPLEP